MHIIFDYEKDIKFRPSAGDGEITGLLSNDVDFNNFLIEWNEMRKKHYNDEITDEEFEDWKVNYPDSLKKIMFLLKKVISNAFITRCQSKFHRK